MELGKSIFASTSHLTRTVVPVVWVINRFITTHDLIPDFQDGNYQQYSIVNLELGRELVIDMSRK